MQNLPKQHEIVQISKAVQINQNCSTLCKQLFLDLKPSLGWQDGNFDKNVQKAEITVWPNVPNGPKVDSLQRTWTVASTFPPIPGACSASAGRQAPFSLPSASALSSWWKSRRSCNVSTPTSCPPRGFRLLRPPPPPRTSTRGVKRLRPSLPPSLRDSCQSTRDGKES